MSHVQSRHVHPHACTHVSRYMLSLVVPLAANEHVDGDSRKLGSTSLPEMLPHRHHDLPTLHFGLCQQAHGNVPLVHTHTHTRTHMHMHEGQLSRMAPRTHQDNVSELFCMQTPQAWEVFEWQEGQDWLFDDNDMHYVVNGRGSRRLTFTLDVLRPNLPLPVWLVNQWLTRYHMTRDQCEGIRVLNYADS